MNRILYLDVKTLNNILIHCNFLYKNIFTILYYTGLRISEFCNIKTSDIDFENKIVFINSENSKTKIHKRKIFLNEICFIAFNNLIMRNRIPSESCLCYIPSSNTIKQYIKFISKKSNIRFSAHSFRHSFITNFYNKCKDLNLTRIASGHKSINSTMIYMHYNEIDLRKYF